MSEVPLDGGWQTDVRRVGDVVLRSPKPQSRTVVGLLTHLAQVGFDASPRPLDGGFASDGREQQSTPEPATNNGAFRGIGYAHDTLDSSTPNRSAAMRAKATVKPPSTAIGSATEPKPPPSMTTLRNPRIAQ